MAKKYFKCRVCGDIHYGQKFPDPCPTCKTPNSYNEITKEEAKKAMGL